MQGNDDKRFYSIYIKWNRLSIRLCKHFEIYCPQTQNETRGKRHGGWAGPVETEIAGIKSLGRGQ